MEERWREEGMEGEKGRKKEKSHYRQEIKCGMGLRRTEMALAQHQCYQKSKCGIPISCKKINKFFRIRSPCPKNEMWNTKHKGNPNESSTQVE